MSLEGGLAGWDDADKFFKKPELVERLLLSTKQLAETSTLTREVLRRAPDWEKLVKRTFPKDQGLDQSNLEDKDLLASERIKARILAEILTIILDDSEPWKEELPKDLKLPPVFHLGNLPLLHAICESFPSNKNPYSDHIDVGCFCGKTHRVSPFGFILLEDVEATLDQKDMSMLLGVDRVRIQATKLEGPILRALASMVERSSWPVKMLDVQDFGCTDKETAEAVLTLIENSQSMPSDESWILIYKDIGTDGWAAVRRVVETLSQSFGKEVKLDADRRAMSGGRREDLKAIWYLASEWGVQSGRMGTYGYFSVISYSKAVYGKRGGWEGVKSKREPLVSR